MTLATDLVDALADRGFTQDNADEDVLAVAASIVAVAGMRPMPGLRVELTDPVALVGFLAVMVEVGTLNAAVAR